MVSVTLLSASRFSSAMSVSSTIVSFSFAEESASPSVEKFFSPMRATAALRVKLPYVAYRRGVQSLVVGAYLVAGHIAFFVDGCVKVVEVVVKPITLPFSVIS